jgi:hypothetical protein
VADHETKVVSLTPFLEERRGYRCGTSFEHVGTFLVDSTRNTVECKACGKEVNPIAVLLQMCRSECRWREFKRQYVALKQEIETKSRAKCQHCGKFTRLGIRGAFNG